MTEKNVKTNKPAKPEVSEQDQIAQRRQKLDALREQEGQAYPSDFRRNALSQHLHTDYGDIEAEVLEHQPLSFSLAGRIMTRRVMGKASFCHIQDMHGKIQLYVQRDVIGTDEYAAFKKWDIGDIMGAQGTLFKTKTGELSLRVTEIRLLTKALRPLPEKFHGVVDQEIRYRQRYLDLIMNQDTRDTFKVRAHVISYLRDFLINRDFMEVETPMMQTLAGGAAAKPFMTYHNALGIDLFLRIAPELYLKRLVVGGFERVFEINRNFRNEGLSTRHNPEFTMVEFYQAYADYHDLMDMTEELLRGMAATVYGNETIEYQGDEYDFGKPFDRMTMKESILKYNPDVEAADLEDMDAIMGIAARLDISVEDHYGLGKIQVEIFDKTVEHLLKDPTFITAYPAEVSPLARRSDDDPFVTDRFEMFIGGREIANGFSELNDPEDQAARFKAQREAQDAGDEEAMAYDADYITALEHGLPPTAGEGIGIDRLVMLFTNAASIRDVLLFPHMRPRSVAAAE